MTRLALRPMRRLLLLVVLGLVVAACGPIEPVLPPLEGLTLTLVAEDLEEPVGLASPPGDDRIFVLERFGRIRVIDRGKVVETPVLDLTHDVNGEGEKGLIGLAFHPEFRGNQKVYVLYNNAAGNSRLVEYRMGSALPAEFDPESARLVLELEQKDIFHQGGYIVFGPDGYLWISFGDDGFPGDPQGHSQNPYTLHGAVLRIDVDSGRPYAIPPDNPFADGIGGAPEIWSYGFRNPWRFAIDSINSVLYVADVGQFVWEEVNIGSLGEPGKNYGWPIREGEDCFEADACDVTGLTDPALVYGHDLGCAVIGGPVYRGSAIPELAGTYFYGDHCIGWIRSLRLENAQIVDQNEWTDGLDPVTSLTSFGIDAGGEMYVLQKGGRIYRVDPVRQQ